jgi:anti-sigma B factor antagonist
MAYPDDRLPKRSSYESSPVYEGGRTMENLPQPFFAARSSDGPRTLLELGGECDAASLETLNAALTDAVDRAADEVVVDLGKTTFLDSLALGALTAAAKRARAQGRGFRVIRPSPAIRRTLEITGLDSYLLGADTP